MKTIFKTIIIIGMLVLQSCSTNKVLWVNSYKSNCTAGVGDMQCLLVNKEANLENANWENFYSTIEGFNFNPGYFQKIKVKTTKLKEKDVPADASSIKYKLIEVIEQVEDIRFRLNDIWVVTSINGKTLDKNNDLPQVEINISKMKILGNDGCNNFTGKIKLLTSNEILIENIAATRKMCPDMTITNLFNAGLQNTSNYNLKELNLFFYDKEGNETLVLKKID
jgi:heat shock protein HslJ